VFLLIIISIYLFIEHNGDITIKKNIWNNSISSHCCRNQRLNTINTKAQIVAPHSKPISWKPAPSHSHPNSNLLPHAMVFTTRMLYSFLFSQISITLRNLKLFLYLIFGTLFYDCTHQTFNTSAHKLPHFRKPTERKHSTDRIYCWYSSLRNN
jgi:hypothetical protein